jgi:hypothetical protein
VLTAATNALVDDQQVLGSGFVLLGIGSVLTLNVANLKFEVVAFDDEGSVASLEGENPTPTSLRIRLKNFKSPLATAYGPAPVGNLSGGKVLLSVCVNALGERLKAVNYCILFDPLT